MSKETPEYLTVRPVQLDGANWLGRDGPEVVRWGGIPSRGLLPLNREALKALKALEDGRLSGRGDGTKWKAPTELHPHPDSEE